MADTGIAIELTVPGYDDAMSKLQAITAELNKAGSAASSVRGSSVSNANNAAEKAQAKITAQANSAAAATAKAAAAQEKAEARKAAAAEKAEAKIKAAQDKINAAIFKPDTTTNFNAANIAKAHAKIIAKIDIDKTIAFDAMKANAKSASQANAAFVAQAKAGAQATAQANSAAASAAKASAANINKMGSAAGLSGPMLSLLTNPALAAGAAIGIAVGAIIELTKAANEAVTALQNIGIISGGTNSEAAKLSSVGRAAGVDDMGALARQFAAGISSDSLKAAFGNRAGIHAFGPQDPNMDAAGKLLAATKYIMYASAQDAKMFAHIEGLDELLKLRNLSEATKQNITQNDPQFQAMAMNPATETSFQEFNVALGRAGEALLELWTVYIAPIMPVATSLLNLFTSIVQIFTVLTQVFYNVTGITGGLKLLADGINLVAEMLGGFAMVLKGASEYITNPLLGSLDIASGMQRMIDAFKSNEDRAKDHKKAIEDNTAALQYNTHNGFYGGGDRARGGVPSKWIGVNAGTYVGGAAKLGAFNL